MGADKDKLKDVIEKMTNIPTLPVIFSKLDELLRKPNTTASQVANLISKDQSTTFRILRIVNSAFYGFPYRVSTVDRAVVIIGFNSLKNLILASSVMENFSKNTNKCSFNLEELWRHSIGVAIIAKSFGLEMKYADIEELFVGGLLHDIGKLIEAYYLTSDFEQIQQNIRENNLFYRSAEIKILSFDHALIGALLAKKWNLPEKLKDMIALHHKINDATQYRRELNIIHLSDIIARSLELGHPGDEIIPKVDLNAWKQLGLRFDQLEKIMTLAYQGFEDMVSILKS